MSKRTPSKGGLLANCGPKLRSCFQTVFTPCCGRKFGNYISTVYLFIKIIMLANVIGQLFLLNKFLGFDFNFYGIYVVSAMLKGEDWTESPRFPRVTLCDFDIRRLGNIHRYTIQCVLTINLYSEMMYLLIWFWLVFLSALTVVGILLLLTRMLYTNDRYMYVEKHLVMDNVYNPDSEMDRVMLRMFVGDHLCMDGVLMFRLIGHNTNKVVVNELICKMFHDYKLDKEVRKVIEDQAEHCELSTLHERCGLCDEPESQV